MYALPPFSTRLPVIHTVWLSGIVRPPLRMSDFPAGMSYLPLIVPEERLMSLLLVVVPSTSAASFMDWVIGGKYLGDWPVFTVPVTRPDEPVTVPTASTSPETLALPVSTTSSLLKMLPLP